MEQRGIGLVLIRTDEHVEAFEDGEDHVEVRAVQQIVEMSLHPLVALDRLAFSTATTKLDST